jgi:hypothetical protein
MACITTGRLALIFILATSGGMQAQTDPPKPPPNVVSKQIQMAGGAARLDKKVDAKSAKVGDVVTAKLMDDIHCPDGLVMPKDSTLSGHVVEVQASQKKSDSKLVLLFDQLTIKGKPPIPVKVTLMGLVSPPVSGPDTTSGKVDSDGMAVALSQLRQGAPPAPGQGNGSSHPGATGGAPAARPYVWDTAPNHQAADMKDSTVPDVDLSSSITDANSGTMTSKGKNTQLPMWTQMRIAIIAMPPEAASK